MVQISEMGAAIHKVETDLRQRTKLQAAKDTAQVWTTELKMVVWFAFQVCFAGY